MMHKIRPLLFVLVLLFLIVRSLDRIYGQDLACEPNCDMMELEYVCGDMWAVTVPEGAEYNLYTTQGDYYWRHSIGTGDPEYFYTTGQDVVGYTNGVIQQYQVGEYVACGEDSPYTPPDNRISWATNAAAVYSTPFGADVYCVDETGAGHYDLSLDENVPSGYNFGCGTFYILESGEYQLNFTDGTVLIAENLQFEGAYAPNSTN